MASTLDRLPLLVLLLATAAGDLSAQEAAPPLVTMERLRPHELRVTTFTLAQPQAIEIEAVGADGRFPRDGAIARAGRLFGIDVDGINDQHGWRGNAWILDAATRRVVWELRESRTRDGGSDGLRTFTGRLQLPAGTYEAYYAAFTTQRVEVRYSGVGGSQRREVRYDDDGFSRKLGFTIRGRGTADNSAVVGASFQRTTFVSLTNVPPGETRTAGFTVSRPVRVEVYAIGEITGGSTYDHGWIMNADTRERVFAFDEDDSEHAGGASKNRTARRTLTLQPGRYVASFAMDDSHHPADWNAAPPLDPAYWGLTVRVLDAADRAHIRPFAYRSIPENAVVSLNRVGDDDWKSAGFTVTKAVDVLILAMGEGTARGMDDYGWIIDARTRQRIWTMAHEGSEHAGGAERNRAVRQTVRLQPGSYIANFRTDASHSFERWSSAAPIEGELWGLTVVPVNAADRAAFKPYEESEAEAGVLVRLIGMTDGEDARATFTLEQPANVRIYAIGEGTGGTMHDYGWIEDRNTRQVVWEMTYRTTTHAGGSDKNRQFNGVVHLPAGSYVLRYRSDDSHSSARWNSTMPDDPRSYGITVYRQ